MFKQLSTMLPLLACLALGVVLMTTSFGCKSDAGVTNYAGSYEAYVAGSPDEIADVTVSVLEDLKLTVVSSQSSKVDGVVVGRTAQGHKIDIEIDRETDTVCQLWVRVGTLGDEYLSKRIIADIKKRAAR